MSQPHYVLEIRSADGTAETHEIYDERRILGRSKVKADLHLGDKKASGKHAELVFQEGLLSVRDLGSTNGTFFHGTRMEGAFQLKPGEGCKVGDAQIRLMAVHGLPEEDDARTVVGAPAFVEEEPQVADRTRALDAAELAGIVGGAAPQPAQQPQAASAPVARGGYHEPEPLVEPEPDPPPMEPLTGNGGGWDEPPMDEDRTRALPHGVMERGGMDGGGLDLVSKDQVEARGGYPDEPAHPPPAAPSHYEPSPSHGGGSTVQIQLQTSGGDIFKAMIGHYLLCMVTLFLYAPWAVVKWQRFLYSRLVVTGTPRGRVHLSFHGTGGQLFKIGIVGYLLTLITIGIYGPWFVVKLARFFLENTTATTDDGSEYHFSFQLAGKELFVFLLVNYLLCLVTLGLYTPWFICKLQSLVMERFNVLSQGQRVGGFEFHGTGGSLLGTFLLGYLLILVTLGIYQFWFQVKLIRWMAERTFASFGYRRWQGSFTGKGLELFKISIIAAFLIPLTIGIWMFWYLADVLKFQFNNTRYDEVQA